MLIQELTNKECIEILTRLRFGRLGCSHDNQPYIVPIYFAYGDSHLYTFATVGQKIEWMRANPLVCVQADEIADHYHWTSVIVQGRYEELLARREGNPERRRAYELLQEQAMWWEPASVAPPHLVAAEKAIPIYYRIHIDKVTGRRASPDRVESFTLLERGITPKSEGGLKRSPPGALGSAGGPLISATVLRMISELFGTSPGPVTGLASPGTCSRGWSLAKPSLARGRSE